ncbi:MAG TPA: hypothetical protein PLD35_01780 [Caldisericia bacterium]|jgi:uncharacterized protein YoxC|nr:hypothetical protein [Caldisericia bacterium]HOJ15737.1 hypothetical protein [Caldisericia bacterium]HOW02451.1 hypothetical protein [Caldisericia bacterium]HPO28732.1 hypothetical protein [Caldisericia bacterium]HXK70825.1 hypothetical protein [Caldisericia bacterium]
MVENILIFSIILIAFVIIAFLILFIIITVYLTKRLSELSKAITVLVSTLTKKSNELIEQATNTLKSAEKSIADEKDLKNQQLLKNIFKGVVYGLELYNMFKKTRKGESINGEGRK